MLFIFLGMACVSAEENQTLDDSALEITNEQEISIEENLAGNFKELDEEIDAYTGNEFKLKKDYIYNSTTDSDYSGIWIDEDNFVIDGDGHTINALGQTKIFYITANNVTLKNINFINGNSTGLGGAIEFETDGSVENCNFTNNQATYRGGAIYFKTTGTVTACSFTENKASSGGAVSFGENGLVRTSIFNNNAGTDKGGAIEFQSEGNISYCNFTNNRANTGGAIYSAINATAYNCLFNCNSARFGGAISFQQYGNVKNSKFNSNNATSIGGAIDLIRYGIINNCSFTNNTAGSTGGAINLKTGSIMNCDFNNNNVTSPTEGEGGAAHVEDGTIISSTFNNNTALLGGAVYFTTKGIVKKSNFTSNIATDFGGAIFFSADGTVEDSNFNNNSVDAQSGGAVHIGDGTITGCSFTNNKAHYYGGAINFFKNGTITKCNFTNNNAEQYYGGAIRIKQGTITDNNFTQNSARSGGAIYLIQNGTLTNNGFTKNHADENGGAIYIEQDGAIDESEFEANSAKSGGAIYDAGNLNISNSDFKDNDATDGTDNAALAQTATIATYNLTPENIGPYFAANLEIRSCTSNITYGDDFKISIFVSYRNSPLNEGNATIIFGDNIGAAQVTDGIANIEVKNIPAGIWTTYIRYVGPTYVAKKPVTLTVNPKNAAISITESDNITYGETVKIKVTVSDDDGAVMEGNISTTVNGIIFTTKVENGTATIEIPNLNVGNYTAEIVFDDENYTSSNRTVEFSVCKRHVALNIIEAKNVTFNQTVMIKANVSLENGTLNEGNISTTLNGQTYTSKVENGTATIEIPHLDAGNYTCQVIFNGGNNYDTPQADVDFEVMPLPVEIELSAGYIFYGDSVKINANVTANGKAINEGNISTTLNGQTYTSKVENGIATIEIPHLNVGIYPVTVVFDGGRNYIISSKPITLNVYQQLVYINITEARNIIYGETAEIKVNVTANGKAINEGNISTTINEQTYTSKVENGIATIEIPHLNAGNYSFTVTFDGGENYDRPTANSMLEVTVLIVDFQVNVKNITYGDEVRINATVTANGKAINEGNISTTINGQTYTSKVENGTASIEVSGLDMGSYSCNVIYDNNGNTNSPSEDITFEVSLASIDLNITVIDNTYGKQAKIVLYLTNNGKAVNEGNILTVIDKKYVETEDPKTGTIEIEHITLNMKSLPVNNGYVIIEIPTLDAGSYPCNITFDGGKNLNNLTKEFVLDIMKQNSQITASNAAYVINYDGTYSATLKNSEGKAISGEKVTFTFDGKNVGSVITNAKGIATISLTAKTLKTAKSGAKNLVIKFESSNYNNAIKNVKITVNKEKTKIVAKKKTFKQAKKAKYSITLKDSKGKAVKKVKVKLKINGKTYKAKTNSKGKAVFKIKLTKKGTFKTSIKFKGNSYYKAANKNIKIKIK